MSKLLPVVFGAIIVAGLGVYDYVRVSREQASAAALGLAAPKGYIASLRERLMPAGQAAPIDLAGHLGEPPRGWDRKPYDPEDGERLAGQPMQPTEALRSTTNDLLQTLRLAVAEAGRSAETFEKADSLVVLSLAPTSPVREEEITRADYGVVRGMPFALLEPVDVDAATGARTPAPYRRLVAALGSQAKLMIVTNADDASLVQVLATLDLPGLIAALGTEVPGVSEEKPVFVGTASVKTPLVKPEVKEAETVAEADAPKGPCVRRGTVLSCE